MEKALQGQSGSGPNVTIQQHYGVRREEREGFHYGRDHHAPDGWHFLMRNRELLALYNR